MILITKAKVAGLYPFMIFAVALSACHFDSDVVFRNDKFSWEMPIPLQWERLKKEEIENIRQQGEMLLGRAGSDGQLRTQVEPLVWCLVEKKNMFSSNLVTLKDISREQYVEDTRKIQELIKLVLEGQAIEHKVTSGEEMIDDLRFMTFAVHLYNEQGQLLATQKQYRRFFGEQELSVTLSFSDPKKGEQLQRVWRGSQFAVY